MASFHQNGCHLKILSEVNLRFWLWSKLSPTLKIFQRKTSNTIQWNWRWTFNSSWPEVPLFAHIEVEKCHFAKAFSGFYFYFLLMASPQTVKHYQILLNVNITHTHTHTRSLKDLVHEIKSRWSGWTNEHHSCVKHNFVQGKMFGFRAGVGAYHFIWSKCIKKLLRVGYRNVFKNLKFTQGEKCQLKYCKYEKEICCHI